MKWKNLYYTLWLVLALHLNAGAQVRDYSLLLRSGSYTPEKNVAATGNARMSASPSQKSFVIIQFEDIPSEEERTQLRSEGIELLEYIPNYAYTATISGSGNSSALARMKGRAVIRLTAEQKMERTLVNGQIPIRSVKVTGMADLWISYPRTFAFTEIANALKARNWELIGEEFKNYQILTVRVPFDQIRELAGEPYVQYVQAIPQEDKSFNNRSVANSRANILASSLPGGRNLTGKGVVVGVGDDSNPLQHVDFNTRIINRTPIEAGSHGVHVMGTLGSAGLMNELFAGYAPKANIVAQSYSGLLAYAPQYVQDFGMVVTNNSYGGDVNTCATFGVYDLYSYLLDRQAIEMPSLHHVFAAGNSGNVTCSPYPAGFANVLGGYQTAKNVLCVGSTTNVAAVSATSSRGPVLDGRIKPEITAQGVGVMSTLPTNLYGSGTGTSMSSPAVAGGAALLYERYRQLNSNQNPKNALIKALLCNGATDKGNEGPDYKFGFGWLNLDRSVKMLESQSYKNDSVGHQDTQHISIQVPSNTAQLKVMLYWNDPAGSVLSSQNLVHNLDVWVKNPLGATTLPRLLDPAPANVNNVAGTGVDNLNNMEQVVINNPVEGSYTISVKGTAVGQKPLQDYVVVYDIIPNSLTLTYPIGNERLKDADAFYVSWDAYGNVASTFTVQYSLNNGGSWTTIGNNLAAATRQLLWTIPAGTIAEKAKVKVIQNSTGVESVSEPFTILGVPAVTLSTLQCEGYIAIDWTPVAGATDYEVVVLKDDEMVPVGTTSATNYVFNGMLKDSTYYVSVRARINGQPGRRALAISRKPDSGTCAGAISNNDLKIESILTPAGSGRRNTSSQLGNQVFVKIRIKNLDDVDFNGPVNVGYVLNGSAIPVESINPFIEKGKTYDHTFSVGANLFNPGDYTFKVFIHRNNDVVAANDTLIRTFRQLSNDAIALPFTDDLEYLPVQSVVAAQVGLAGDGRYDFSPTTDAGRIRSFVNSGFAKSGQRALTLDVNRFYTGGNTNYLVGTYNLGAYDMNSDDVRLIFSYKNHGQKTNVNNRVWIRGKDTDAWIEIYDLFANQNLTGQGYKTIPGIEVSALLSQNNKNFSSSFQVRWGQWGRLITADYSNGSGYSFDDVKLFSVTDDIQVLALNTPVEENCGLGTAEPISIKIRNSSARNIAKLPIAFMAPDGSIVRDTIPSINKRTTIDFTFAGKANLSAIGPLNIKVWSALSSDSYHDNDTLTVKVYNAPVLSTFPYLETFENNDGFWSAKGTNSSWQYGTPVSANLNKAAGGSKIWKTNLSGGHNDKEESYLYSPCFNVSGLAVPTLSFSAAVDLEVCEPTPCDYVYLEYSGNNGPWTRLGAVGQGTNWYNKTYSGSGAWSLQDYLRWHVATIPLPTGLTTIKLRFVMMSDGFTHREGIAIDDVHIYDRQSVINDSQGVPVTQNVNGGSGWIHFAQSGKVIASIFPNGQNLGNTEVQAYVNTGSVRNANGQYYLNRSFTVKPANPVFSDSVTVRFFFLETESEALLSAGGCGNCGKPGNAFELGVSKYRNPADVTKEDGSIANSVQGGWTFHPAGKVKIVPYDKGYYAEMKVMNFSEFWLSKAFAGNPDALPVELISFNARKKEGVEQKSDVIVEWETASEENFDHFDVEVARGDAALRGNGFVALTRINGEGGLKTGRTYSFTDQTPDKEGTYYYRLKMTDADSTFQYSRIRAVNFDHRNALSVFPNPSKGVFYIGNLSESDRDVSVNVYDLHGRVLKSIRPRMSDSMQRYKVDLSGKDFREGMYVLEIISGETKQAVQVLKD
nr:S8 family serine peptidase [uncultured Dyadobacter sp.]